jgi:excisionase family DNA binding protein
MFDSPDSEPIFERLLDSEQAAELIKIHPKTLQRYARAGVVSGVRVGKLWRFRSSDLLASICGDERNLDDVA